MGILSRYQIPCCSYVVSGVGDNGLLAHIRQTCCRARSHWKVREWLTAQTRLCPESYAHYFYCVDRGLIVPGLLWAALHCSELSSVELFVVCFVRAGGCCHGAPPPPRQCRSGHRVVEFPCLQSLGAPSRRKQMYPPDRCSDKKVCGDTQ